MKWIAIMLVAILFIIGTAICGRQYAEFVESNQADYSDLLRQQPSAAGTSIEDKE